MKISHKIEEALISLTCIVCALLVIKLVYSLRMILPWRVNCWFCNINFWVKFFERNSWTCPKCEQYNGFTKDGDYNKPITTANVNEVLKTSNILQKNPPSNGFCQMCNINQQLKVAQLANFVPMNDNNFDEEIESYRMQLEKAYKLCSPCKKVLQTKLYKEKEILLGTKLIEARTPDKKSQKLGKPNTKLLKFINKIYKITAIILLALIAVEFYTNVENNEALLGELSNIKNVFVEFLWRILSIIKMKVLLTFPMLDKYLMHIPHTINLRRFLFKFDLRVWIHNYSIFVHEALASFAISMLLIEYFCNKNKSKSYILTEALWITFIIMCFIQHFFTVDQTIMSLLKLLCIVIIIFVNKGEKTTVKQTKKYSTSPIKLKNLTNSSKNSMMEEEDVSMETDDDVSLSQFGLHNLSDSSNEIPNAVHNSMISGRCFTPRSDNSIWSKPKLNSTFCVNSVLKSPSSVSEQVFSKPSLQKLKKEDSFRKYQNLNKNDSDSDLDESISSLYIGSPKKSQKNASIFSLRKFTATPNFVVPTPSIRSRPLISPSKLGHSTSWVAGGYWGSEGERQIFSVNGSRSSSQSSGFESQTSSNQRNFASQPPSREESVCGEPDRSSFLLDRFQNCNMNSFAHQGPHNFTQKPQSVASQTPSNFSRISSPVYPQMQYNSHVHIPQPRFAQQNPPSMFAQPGLFKTPGGPGIIKLPHNSFTSR